MANFGTVFQHLLLVMTLTLELVSFMTAHMIGSRNIKDLHDGIFYRCTYPRRDYSSGFNCLWWTSDTFNIDKPAMRFCTIIAMISLIFLGFTVVYAIICYCFDELKIKNYNAAMAIASAINSIFLFAFIIVFTFLYATDTKFIPYNTTSLTFSWSYYLVIVALGTNMFAMILFLYKPLRQRKSSRSQTLTINY